MSARFEGVSTPPPPPRPAHPPQSRLEQHTTGIPHAKNRHDNGRVLKQHDKAFSHAEQSRKWAVSFLGEGSHPGGLEVQTADLAIP